MKITYNGLHKWLGRNLRKAGECSFCQEKCKTDWALKKKKRHAKIAQNYIELCRKCHFDYDWSENRREKQAKIAKRMSEKTSLPVYCIELDKTYKSISEAVRQTGIKSIGYCLRKNRKNIAGGLHWKKLSTQAR